MHVCFHLASLFYLQKLKEQTLLYACPRELQWVTFVPEKNPGNDGWNLQCDSYVIQWFADREVLEDVCSHFDDSTVDPTDENEQLVYAKSYESGIEAV